MLVYGIFQPKNECLWQKVQIVSVHPYCIFSLLPRNFVVLFSQRLFHIDGCESQRHEMLQRSNLTSCNPVSLILFGTALLRWVTVESWHNSAEGHSIRSYAHTLMWTVAQAQRNSSVVCSRGDTWDKVTLNYWSTHQSLPLESVSHLFIGLSLQQGHTKQVCFKPDLPRSNRVILSLVRGCWCCTAQCPLSLILPT